MNRSTGNEAIRRVQSRDIGGITNSQSVSASRSCDHINVTCEPSKTRYKERPASAGDLELVVDDDDGRLPVPRCW